MKDLFLLLLRGKFKKAKKIFFQKLDHYLDKKRSRNFFSPISRELLVSQNDYRPIIYKNFNYEHSIYRETFKKFKSNKGGLFERNNKIRHFYADFYEESLQNHKVENLLEIGIEDGGSLRAWSTLFPDANIFGADVNKNYLFEELKIKTFYTDQLDENELNSNYDRVISEATKAFGKPEVFMEKCVLTPKHIEVQILADSHGSAIHLFERDCSIQRRNQKLIEIAPSPQLNEDQRHYIGDLAVKAAKAVGYENAGTVEFLLGTDNKFYFMEMNTRLQVEHTISETITGIDIVQEQVKIASGDKLRYKQEEVSYRGFAIEFRINAEDPKQDFLPSFGKITRYYAAGGPGVRTDASIYTGYIIPPYYDSMCAKLTIWAMDWTDAIHRGRRALGDIGVFGIKTTIPYYLEILKNHSFIGANFNTSFVDMHPELSDYEDELPPEIIAAAIGAAIAAHEGI